MKLGRNLILGSGARGAAMVANLLVGMFLMPFIVHRLGDKVYGYWTLVATTIGYYGILDLGIVSSVTYFLAKGLSSHDAEEENGIVNAAFWGFAAIGFILFLITALIALLSPILISNPLDAIMFRIVILIMGISLAVGFPCRVFIGVLTAHLRFVTSSAIDVAGLLTRAGLIVLSLERGGGIVELAIITSLIDIAKYLTYFLIARKLLIRFDLNLRIGAILGNLRRILGYSIFRIIVKIADQLRFNVQPFLISGFMGVVAVTHYAVASKLSMIYISFMLAFFGVMSPMFSIYHGRNDESSMRRAFIWGVKTSISFSTIFFMFVLFFGRPLIKAWMGANYLDAYIPLVALTGGIFFEVSQIPATNYLYGVAKHRFLAYTTLLEGLLAVVFGLVLIRSYGLTGVAVGCTTSIGAIKLFVLPPYTCKQIKISLKDYYLKTFIPALAVPAMTLFILRLALPARFATNGLISIGAMASIYGVAGLLTTFMFVFEADMKQKFIMILFGDGRLGKLVVAATGRNNSK